MSNVRMKLRQGCHMNALYTFNFGCVPLGHAFHVIKNIYKKIFIEFVNRKIKVVTAYIMPAVSKWFENKDKQDISL